MFNIITIATIFVTFVVSIMFFFQFLKRKIGASYVSLAYEELIQ